MTDQGKDDGPWVIVIGALDPVDATAIRLDRFMLDGAPFVPVFANPDVFRQRMAGTASADRALNIRLALLEDILTPDERIIFDTGQGDPTEMSIAELARIAGR